MRQFFLKYRLVAPLILFYFISISAVSQTKETDTTLVIKNLQKSAIKNIDGQNYKLAIKKLSLANKLAAAPNFNHFKLGVELQIADLYYKLQYYAKTYDETINMIAQSDSLLGINERATAYKLLGLSAIQTGNFNTAALYLGKADSLFTSQNDEINRAIVLHGKGLLALNQKKYETSVRYFDSVIPIFKQNNLKLREANTNINQADAYMKWGENNEISTALEDAKSALQNALEINSEISDIQLSIDGYRISSQIAIRENNIKKAEEDLQLYFNKKDSIKQVYLTSIEEGIKGEWTIASLNEIIAAQKRDNEELQKSLFFGKLTGWLSIALIIILSLFALSLNKNNNLRNKTFQLLKDKNTELLISKDKAEKASQVKAQFLSTITHELRTPMYTVTGLTHLLLEEDPKPEQKEHLNSLKFSGEYLLSLINNILDLNKLEANKVEIAKIPFNLRKRVEGVVTGLKKYANDKKNTLLFEFDPTLPTQVIGDSLKLSQILINLISNSIKFTEKGTVWVRIQNLTQTDRSIMIRFEVEDNGVGISNNKQKDIFETFTQGSLQINRKFGGTGLGLSIVKNLLEIMDTKIHLESKIGKGSKFWFDLTFGLMEKPKKSDKIIIPTDINYDFLINKEVLIVEDNKINQMITKKILEKKQMICTVVDNGMDAVKYVKKGKYDVILMDIHMPGISGIDATKKIREFNKEVPIIALTAVTLEESLEEFFKAGFNEFVPKPFKAEDFFEKIQRVLLKAEAGSPKIT